MQLLYFAHRGEAQTFISALKGKKCDFKAFDLYSFDKGLILIGSEGIESTLIAITKTLTAFSHISEILNFGTSGILRGPLEVGEIYSIRTSYGFLEQSPRFHSFSSEDSSGIDCISSASRVLDDEHSKKLQPFAHCVDRELWAISQCASIFKVPFYAYKYMSDIAGKTTNCLDIKYQAKNISDELYQKYLSLKDSSYKVDEDNFDIDLKMTFSQKAQLKKLLSALAIKRSLSYQDILASYPIEELKKNEKSDKEVCKKLIFFMREDLNPLQSKIDQKFGELFTPIETTGASVVLDSKLEKKKFSIRMDINSDKNLKELAHSLKNFNYQDFLSVMDGNDV